MTTSLDELKAAVLATPTGTALAEEDALRAKGRGPPHRASKLRLFDEPDGYEPRVTLYRDSAAWCPYCQKVWMLLEEKRIPYKVELINMRSYGEKPKAFLAKVPGGFLPAIELDGTTYTESLDIMVLLDDTFGGDDKAPRVVPERGSPAFDRCRELLSQERTLFRAWCDYVFRGSFGSERAFFRELQNMDDALAKTDGPFFLGDAAPSIVDLQYVSHVERMAASVAYWKGRVVRDSAKFPHVDAWFRALEARPSYRASRSDFYTHVRDIPPQYGDGVASRTADQKAVADALAGKDWALPLKPDALELSLQPGWEASETSADAEAAYRLVTNFDAVVDFASRPAGAGVGRWSFARPDRAKLADPVATAAADGSDVKTALREALLIVAGVLKDGAASSAAPPDGTALRAAVPPTGPLAVGVAECLAYLRDRVGCPRDMSFPAARALRSSLGWAVSELGGGARAAA
eukprot:CAMPEP_0185717042 /NCGR_PEP_ID=MMETSP1164-20130828/44046_1 /TAXON_ID=1104430 /ORGANISM="Chrysoreinhardia sp, Strain CCMP2950" /LENGTH=462 /DNA_ID=CAMNT_0028384679 /DNA_START=68 /DNA_END=1456 /DNA_ORIENTATION=-